MTAASALAPSPLQFLLFGPPATPEDFVIWVAEKVTAALISGACNLIRANKLANEMNDAPSAVVFNGQPYCFYSSASSINEGNSVWYQYYNGTAWVQSELALTSWSQGAPSATVFNGQIYVFFQQAAPDNPAILTYLVSSDGSTFGQGDWGAVTSTSVSLNGNTSAAAFNGLLYVFYTVSGSTELYSSSSSDGINWTVNGVVPSTGTFPGGVGSNYMGTTGSPAAVAFTNSSNQAQLYVFHEGGGSDGQLWYNYMDTTGDWHGDTQIPLSLYNTPLSLAAAPTAFTFNGLLYVAFDAGDQLYYLVSQDGSSYSQPVPFGQIELQGTPSVAVFNGQLVCTALNPSNPPTGGAATGYAVTTPGGSWAFMSPILPPLQYDEGFFYTGTDSSANLIVFNNQLYCFAQGCGSENNCGQIFYSTFNGDTWGDVNLLVPSGLDSSSPYMSYSPAPVIWNGNLYLFYNGPGQNGWTYYVYLSNGSWSSNINVASTGLSFTPSPVVYQGDIYLFYTARNQGNSIWWNKTTSSSAEPTWQGSQEIPGLNNNAVQHTSYNGCVAPVAIVFNGNLYLFYITSNWTIAYVQYTGSNGSNSSSDWTTGSPIAIVNNTVNFNGGSTPSYDYSTTGNFTVVTYDNASGTPTLAVYFTGYGTNQLYYVETTNPSASGNWSQPALAGAPLPQGVSPPGVAETAVSWAVAVIGGTPFGWLKPPS